MWRPVEVEHMTEDLGATARTSLERVLNGVTSEITAAAVANAARRALSQPDGGDDAAALYRVALSATHSDPASFPAMCVALWDSEAEDTVEALMALHAACAPPQQSGSGLLGCLAGEEAGREAKPGRSTSGEGAPTQPAASMPTDHGPSYDKRVTRAVVQFGGQGARYFPELKRLCTTLRPLVADFLSAVRTALVDAMDVEIVRGNSPVLLDQGLDFLSWVDGSVPIPDAAYLASAPVSFPLVTATQLGQYLATIRTSGASHATVRRRAAAAIGHSQGIMAAAVFSAAEDEQALVRLGAAAVAYGLCHGCRVQVDADRTTASDARARRILRGRAGAKAPPAQSTATAQPNSRPPAMLAVRGLPVAQLEGLLRSVNEGRATYLRAAAEAARAVSGDSTPAETAPGEPVAAELCLVNGPDRGVVCGPQSALEELELRVERVAAPSGEDQSRVPFSRRRPPAGATYLRVSAPFHHSLFRGSAADELVAAARTVGFRLPAADAACPLLCPTSGEDLRGEVLRCRDSESGGDLVPALVRRVLHEVVHWPRTVAAAAGVPIAGEAVDAAAAAELPPVTHVLDFGPGGAGGSAALTHALVEGRGVRVLPCATWEGFAEAAAAAGPAASGHPLCRDVRDPHWGAAFRPRLLRRSPDADSELLTRFTRLTGTRAVMVAGMTPCTSLRGVDLVAAATNAGYTSELAGGGLPRPAIFERRVRQLASQLRPGRGITLNLLYLNARQWAFQLPLATELRRRGLSIDSITVAAGVPSPEAADDLIHALAACGMRHVSFKPGSVDAIRSVADIARRHPTMGVVLQWTGGRGGGHHSFEDMHAPILATYAELRRVPNLVLVAGSGFGSAAQCVPYFTGAWALACGYPAMPFDAVLVASRVMVAAECRLATAVKRLLVETPGVQREEDWELSYQGDAGGVVTVTSELGEPIHKVATRATLLWREMDMRFFSIRDQAERAAAIARHRDWIIERLNADFQKVYFGRSALGRVVHLPQMTYAEVLRRMVSLMYVEPDQECSAVDEDEPRHEDWRPEGRWIDPTYQARVYDIMRRTEALFRRTPCFASGADRLDRTVAKDAAQRLGLPSHEVLEGEWRAAVPAFLTSPQQLDAHPRRVVDAFVDRYPRCATQVMSRADVDYFLHICRAGGKPVPFVPVIDGDLATWFKKDSLWYCEDLAAVPGRDPERVVVLQGPVAVSHSTVANEPVQTILDGIHAGVRDAVAAARSGAQEDGAVPNVALACSLAPPERGAADVDPHALLLRAAAAPNPEALAARLAAAAGPEARLRASAGSGDDGAALIHVHVTLPDGEAALPAAEDWLEAVAGPAGGPGAVWLRPLLRAGQVAVGERRVHNRIPQLLRPRPGQRWELTLDAASRGARGTALAVYDSSDPDEPVVAVSACPAAADVADAGRVESSAISLRVTVHDLRPATPKLPGARVPLTLQFAAAMSTPACPLRGALAKHTHAAVRAFYEAMWPLNESTRLLTPDDEAVYEFTATAEAVDAFREAVPVDALPGGQAEAPQDFATVAAWKGLMAALLNGPCRDAANLLELVHLENAIRWLEPEPALRAAREVEWAQRVADAVAVASNGTGALRDALRTSSQPPSPASAAARHAVERSDQGDSRTAVEARRLVHVGDTVRARARVEGVENGPSGKTVRVRCVLARVAAGQELPFHEVESAFLFRGVFSDHAATFRSRRLSALLPLRTAADCAVLAAKPWFRAHAGGGSGEEGDAAPAPLRSGDVLRFVLCTQADGIEPGAGNARRRARGVVLRHDPGGRRAREDVVGAVVMDAEGSVANDVAAFLERAGATVEGPGEATAQGGTGASDLADGGYTMLEQPAEAVAPVSNAPYAVASGDLNPIHRSPYLADLAGLPTTITHGMWTSALARGVLQRAVASGDPRRVASFRVDFTGMVFPGDALRTQVRHVGMRSGRMRVVVETVRVSAGSESGDDEGPASTVETVLRGVAEVEQPPTAYLFTGQGSAERGMGMALYDASPAARRVWDAADAHMNDLFGFSILDVVRRNPKELTVHFGGRRGAQLRRSYLALTTEGADGRPKPLLPEITPTSRSFTFRADRGLLFATQFTQPALMLMEKASFEDMRARGVVPGDFLFAGHSLGEYAALAAAGDILRVESLAQLVFLRGLVMQQAVARDEEGRSAYGMLAVDPSRVGPHFTDDAMHHVVECIQKHAGELVQIVNYNVRGRQYVVAGHVVALQALGRACDACAGTPEQARDLDTVAETAVREASQAVSSSGATAIELRRGKATIPIPGVDVPFHSRLLRGGVPAFRACLRQQTDVDAMGAALPLMVHRYVPNLTARPFALTRDYATYVSELTDSPAIRDLCDSTDAWAAAVRDPLTTAHTILVELLAFQFASPVRWIETQDHLFTRGTARLIEVGPTPTLATMAHRTLQSGLYGPTRGRRILWAARDREHVFYEREDAGPTALEAGQALAEGEQGLAESGEGEAAGQQTAAEPSRPAPGAPAPAPEAAPRQPAVASPALPPPPAPAPTPAPASGAGAPTDEPATALDAVRTILGIKLQRRVSAVPSTASIKDLAAGKSTLQNEVVGDLGAEFGNEGPDNGAELPLADLAAAFSDYQAPGKRISGLQGKMVAQKMPGGVNLEALRRRLTSHWHLGPGRTEAALLFALAAAPPKRLPSEEAAHAWLDGVVEEYAQDRGITLAPGAASAGGGGGGGGGAAAAQLAALLAAVGGGAGTSSDGGAPSPPDEPLPVLTFLRALVASKLGKESPADVDPAASLQALSAGKSAVQNEIVGEVQREMASAGAANEPENAAERPLRELAQEYAPTYAGPGTVAQSLLRKSLARVLPSGSSVTQVRERIAARGLGPGRVEAVLMWLCPPAAARGGKRFTDRNELEAWVDQGMDAYAKDCGITLPSANAASKGGGGAAASGGAALAALMEGMGAGTQAPPSASADPDLRRLATEVCDAYGAFLGRDSRADARALEEARTRSADVESQLDAWHAEFGDEFEEGIEARFDPGKERRYNSAWNWGREDIVLARAALLLLVRRIQGELGGVVTPATSTTTAAAAEAYKETPRATATSGASAPPDAPHLSLAEVDGGRDGWQVLEKASRAGSGPRQSQGGAHTAESAGRALSALVRAVQVASSQLVDAFARRMDDGMASMLAAAAAAGRTAEWPGVAKQRNTDPGVFADQLTAAVRRHMLEGASPRSAPSASPASEDPSLAQLGARLAQLGGRSVTSSAEEASVPATPTSTLNAAMTEVTALWARTVMEAVEGWRGGGAGASSGNAVFRAAGYRFTAPRCSIGDDGEPRYEEVPRPGVATLVDYAAELRAGWSQPLSTVPAALASEDHGVASGEGAATTPTPSVPAPGAPLVWVGRAEPNDPAGRHFNGEATETFFRALEAMAPGGGISFAGRVALVTGCGRGSIGVELVKALLEGGATVVATTSRFGPQRTAFFQQLHREHGATSSALYVYPFNQASRRDCEALVAHVYEGLGMDVDVVVPFAAVPENGRQLTSLDARAELAHRVMLTNTLRLLGAIARAKEERGLTAKPAAALLPLSPNHGVFGSDGLYAESKIGLETLLRKWHSEDWAPYITVVGAVIGWTRGTGLMEANNIVAPGVERAGCRTFSAAEMALNFAALLHPAVLELADLGPLCAELGGGFDKVADLRVLVQRERERVAAEAATRKAIVADARHDHGAAATAAAARAAPLPPRANLRGPAFPALPSEEDLRALRKLEGMADLDTVPVVVGFGEVGPWGNARTRWEMEAYGEFSLEGCVEMAWLLGLIKHAKKSRGQREAFVGWVDAQSGDPVPDHEVKARYEERILQHAGIRIIDPDLFNGYDPDRKLLWHAVAVDKDLPPIDVVDREEGEEIRRQAGRDHADVFQGEGGGWQVQLRRGATISVPRALRFDRFVAGQIPKGWDATRLGVPPDLARTVDPVTLYALVSTVEALQGAGITDPYEFYEYVHVSEVGNCVGSGMGGMCSLRGVFRERAEGAQLEGDLLQETFINTIPAWINMLLLSSAGPIKTPVGACATAAASVDVGAETISSGKARVVLVGGADDFGEEGSYEFASMKATSSAAAERAAGRDPREMSRPTAASRAGFMESHGAGTQVLMSASLALRMGCPIYAILALTNTASDKEGRSVPAPGQGILTTARERAPAHTPLYLHLDQRRGQLQREFRAASQWYQHEVSALEAGLLRTVQEAGGQSTGARTESLHSAMATLGKEQQAAVAEYAAARRAELGRTFCERVRGARRRWGNEFWKGNSGISPLRGALAVWGLTVDDIAVASFHGTGTQLNDVNESEVTQLQMERLGRTHGNPLMVVCQKSLTGHPKGAAAAWMLNGLIQSMHDGVVPGNRKADSVDPRLQAFSHLVYPTRSTPVQDVQASILKSFGFGQAGAEVLLVNPARLFAMLKPEQFAAYRARRDDRERAALQHFQEVVGGVRPFVQVKNEAPFQDADAQRVYLDPTARAAYDAERGTWAFPSAGAAASTAAAPPALGGEDMVVFGDADDVLSLELEAQHAGAQNAPAQERPALGGTDSLAEAAMLASMSARTETGDAVHAFGWPTASPASLALEMHHTAAGVLDDGGRGMGVDVEPVATFRGDKGDFIRRNFTEAEIRQCESAPDPAASFAGRWAAKEAAIKALSSIHPEEGPMWKGPGAALWGIEVLRSASGAPVVRLHGHASSVARHVGVTRAIVSISHTADVAVAVCNAQA